MPRRHHLELAARFIAALYATTAGRPGRFRRIENVATRAGISLKPDADRAVRMAEAAGFLVVKVDEPLVMLTAKGIEVAKHPLVARKR